MSFEQLNAVIPVFEHIEIFHEPCTIIPETGYEKLIIVQQGYLIMVTGTGSPYQSPMDTPATQEPERLRSESRRDEQQNMPSLCIEFYQSMRLGTGMDPNVS